VHPVAEGAANMFPGIIDEAMNEPRRSPPTERSEQIAAEDDSAMHALMPCQPSAEFANPARPAAATSGLSKPRVRTIESSEMKPYQGSFFHVCST